MSRKNADWEMSTFIEPEKRARQRDYLLFQYFPPEKCAQIISFSKLVCTDILLEEKNF